MKGETTLEKVFLGEWQTAVYKCQTWENVISRVFLMVQQICYLLSCDSKVCR